MPPGSAPRGSYHHTPATRRNGTDDPAGDLILQSEDIADLPIIALGPQMRPARHIDELCCNPHLIPGPSHAAFEHVLNPELAPHRLYIHCLTLELERGVACKHVKFSCARQLGNDVLG